NRGEAGEDDNARRRIGLVQRLHADEARCGAELQVHDREPKGLRVLQQACEIIGFRDVSHSVSPPLERFLQGARKRGVVLDDQETRGLLVHGLTSYASAAKGMVSRTLAPPPER